MIDPIVRKKKKKFAQWWRNDFQSKPRVTGLLVFCYRGDLLRSSQPGGWQEGKVSSRADAALSKALSSLRRLRRGADFLICFALHVQRMHHGVERDIQHQKRKEEKRRLLEEQILLQQQLEERDRLETIRLKVSRWAYSPPSAAYNIHFVRIFILPFKRWRSRVFIISDSCIHSCHIATSTIPKTLFDAIHNILS